MSMNSYMQQQKTVATKATTKGSGSGSPHDEPEEESGWTAYFEDFSNDNINREEYSYCSSFGSPSLVSDAASCAAWKLSNKHRVDVATSKMPKKLKFKKPRARQICDDDSLEDTASSPVNSPKVSDFEPVDHVNPRKPDDHMYSSLGKGTASEHYSEMQQEQRSMNFNVGNNDCTDLKGRGLCLVPLSMLVNYLG